MEFDIADFEQQSCLAKITGEERKYKKDMLNSEFFSCLVSLH